MTDVSVQQPPAETIKRPSRLAEFWSYFRENRGAVFGLWAFVAFVLVALLADVLAPYSPTEQFRDHIDNSCISNVRTVFFKCDSHNQNTCIRHRNTFLHH